MSGLRLVIVQRDGALCEATPPDAEAGTPLPLPGVIPALLDLKRAGYRFALAGDPQARPLRQSFIVRLFATQGIEFDPTGDAPRLLDGLAATPLDRAASYLIAGCEADLAPAALWGITPLRVGGDAPGWPQIAQRIVGAARRATVRRTTGETDVAVEVDLSTEGPTVVATGLGFFDHMLEQIARHGGFALQLHCRGDLHIDEHHTIEDCALALGAALRQALGDKRGIARYGFLLPMDEAQAQVAIDLSGRPYFVWSGVFGRDRVGEMPTELVPHFFRSLAESLGAAVHVSVSGENTHHMVEACFKGVGRALRQAIRAEGHQLPSTKGTL